ncbi:MAG: DUF433 domain-containing protein [Chloroflexi bacterium]|nr:DUF433 domain-containing protein [Chloroflexota bacterium]
MSKINGRPSFSGVYPVSDAAALIEATTPHPELPSTSLKPLELITTRHLFRWVKEGLTGRYLAGLTGREVALTFKDLVSLRMVAIFRSYGIKPSEIRKAHNILQNERGWSHPFAMEPLWISGLNIYVRENNIPIAITKNWQVAFDFFDQFVGPVHRLLFNKDEEAQAWEPVEGILLDPRISFGEPCIKGTRIPTQVLWALNAGGDPPERIADAYEMPVERVNTAIDWEQRLEQRPAA